MVIQEDPGKATSKFKYLGCQFQSDGGVESEIDSRIQAGWCSWRKTSGVLCDSKIPIRLKGKVYWTVVRPALLYGTETLAVTKGMTRRIDAAEMRMLRWMNEVAREDRIRNTHIRGTTKVRNVSSKI